MLFYGVGQLLAEPGEPVFRPYGEGAQERIFAVSLQPHYPKDRPPTFRDQEISEVRSGQVLVREAGVLE
jgi:hypothetical protein|nr:MULTISPECIES: hypothetical protein [Noviherbaspirillum]